MSRSLPVAKWFLVAGAIVLPLSHSSPAGSQALETASLAIGLAQQFFSLAQPRIDPTLEMVKYQLNLVTAMDTKIGAVQANTEEIIRQLSALPNLINTSTIQLFDEEQRKTTFSKISLLRSLADDLMISMQRRDRRAAADVTKRLRDWLDALHESSFNLMGRNNDALVPVIVATMIADVSALRMLRPIGNEMNNRLKVYDDRLATVGSVVVPGSLASMRATLQSQRQVLEAELAKELSGEAGRVQAGEWIWYSHTLQVEKEVVVGSHRHPCHAPTGDLCDTESYPVYGKRPVDEHTAIVSRRVEVTYLTPDKELYAVSIHRGNRAVQPSRVDGATLHLEADEKFEQAYEALHDISVKISRFNSIINALISLNELDRISSAARALIVKWNDVNARSLMEQTQVVKAVALPLLLQNIQSLAREDRAREIVTASIAIREAAGKSNQEAKKTFVEAIKRGTENRWLSDVMLVLQMAKLSVGVLELEQRLNIGTQPQQTSPSGPQQSGPAAAPAGAGPAGASNPGSAIGDQVERVVTVGSSDLEKEQAVEATIQRLKSQPLDRNAKLPAQATRQEVEILRAITLLDSIADTLSDRQIRNYNNTLKRAFGGDLRAIAESLVISTPTAGGLLDLPNRMELRRQLQELAKPYAELRMHNM